MNRRQNDCQTKKSNRLIVIPIFGAVMRPEYLKVFERGTTDGEAFRPHTFREEGGDTKATIAIDAIAGASGLKLLGSGKIKEIIKQGFHRVEYRNGDAVVNGLEYPPSS